MTRGKETQIVVRLHSRLWAMNEEERKKWFRDALANHDRQAQALLRAVTLNASFHDDFNDFR